MIARETRKAKESESKGKVKEKRPDYKEKEHVSRTFVLFIRTTTYSGIFKQTPLHIVVWDNKPH